MKRDFDSMIKNVKAHYESLMRMQPVTRDDLEIGNVPGVYLFSEKGRPLYVGRTRRLRKRLLEHSCESVKDAPFAFRLAREATGNAKASYKKNGSRKSLLANPIFAAELSKQKARIGKMFIRYVHVPDDIEQALLEIYASGELNALHNHFKTT